MTEPQDEHGDADPTLMRNQPALTSTEGTVWIVAGSVTAGLVGAMMLTLWWRLDAAVALIGALTTVVLLLLMIVVRYVVRARRPRLVTLATLFWVMVLTDLALVLAVAMG
jgi:hypothetical protein